MSHLRWCFAMAVASVPMLAGTAGGGPAEALLDELARDHPELRTLVRRYPALLTAFADPESADVLRHAPNLPGTPWRVHDMRRPQPPVVAPLRCDTRPPPEGATALFDGRDLAGWTGDNVGDWSASDGVLTAGGRQPNMIRSSRPLGDAIVHVEFREPAPAAGDWQHRGNGGVFLMGRYEIQILDSYRNPTFPDGQAAAIFGQVPPLVNASAPPGTWQCFDMRWRAALRGPAAGRARTANDVAQRQAGPQQRRACRPHRLRDRQALYRARRRANRAAGSWRRDRPRVLSEHLGQTSRPRGSLSAGCG